MVESEGKAETTTTWYMSDSVHIFSFHRSTIPEVLATLYRLIHSSNLGLDEFSYFYLSSHGWCSQDSVRSNSTLHSLPTLLRFFSAETESVLRQ